VERRETNHVLKIDFTARNKELFRDGLVPVIGREVERCAPILSLEVDVTASSDELHCDGSIPYLGSFVERCGPMRVLVVDEGLRAIGRQQRANFRCVTITRGLEKLLPRHSFAAPCLALLFVPYQRGDSSVPLHLSKLHRCTASILLEVDVTARSKELLRDGCMPLLAHSGHGVERRIPIGHLKIDVRARSKELLCDGRMPICGREVKRGGPILVPVVDEGLHALFTQQRANLRCGRVTRGLAKLLPCHSLPAPSFGS
jgi:hypothetical protein